jgi:hypothetical protein
MGNGVVPHQAAHAVALLLADLATLTAAEHTDLGRDAARPARPPALIPTWP